MEGGVDLMLKASYRVSTSEMGRTPVERLPLHFKGVAELAHASGKTVTGLLVGAEVLDFAG